MLNPHDISTTIQSNNDCIFYINTNKKKQNATSEAKQID